MHSAVFNMYMYVVKPYYYPLPQYPVIAVDNYLPIVDPLTGSQYGQLKVLLAMGSAEQVSALQRMKMESAAGLQVLRPSHQLDG